MVLYSLGCKNVLFMDAIVMSSFGIHNSLSWWINSSVMRFAHCSLLKSISFRFQWFWWFVFYHFQSLWLFLILFVIFSTCSGSEWRIQSRHVSVTTFFEIKLFFEAFVVNRILNCSTLSICSSIYLWSICELHIIGFREFQNVLEYLKLLNFETILYVFIVQIQFAELC